MALRTNRWEGMGIIRQFELKPMVNDWPSLWIQVRSNRTIIKITVVFLILNDLRPIPFFIPLNFNHNSVGGIDGQTQKIRNFSSIPLHAFAVIGSED